MDREGSALLERVAEASAARDREVAASPGRRRAEGIVHTPAALARFVAAEADAALRTHLGLPLGLADRRVALVDPAVGTGAFLAAAFDLAGSRRGGPAACLGFDLDEPALEAARASLGEAFASRAWPLELTRLDTLGAEPVAPAEVAVVMGNPPWAARSGSSARAPSDALLADFRRDDRGAPLGERKSGVLSDDYVRFFRWGAEVVRRAPGGGVLALVTNASFVDGPVHRAMRAALLRWFAWVDVLDLGGSALVARDAVGDAGAGRDENVFPVRPKVAVTIATRPPSHGELLPAAAVRFTRLRGSRAEKLARLAERLEARAFEPHAPLFVLAPGGDVRFPEDAVPLPALFPFHREGVQTNRDDVCVDRDRDALLARLRAFAERATPEAARRAAQALAHYDPERARAAVARALAADPDGTEGLSVRPIAYRPFDVRFVAPVAPLCHRPRPDLIEAMARSSFALLTVRKDRGERAWTHFGAAAMVPDNCFLSARSSCRTRAFPTHGPGGSPNRDAAAASALFGECGEVRVEDALDYALGLLAAAPYRARYGELLLRDYPRVLAPPSRAAFDAVREAGAAVRAAFLTPPSAGAAPVVVGHHAVRPSADFARAIEAASRAFSAIER